MLCIFHLTHKNKFKEKLKYFILSDDIINVIVFLISFSDTCECIEMQLIFICWFIFCNFTKVICSNNCFMEPLNFLYIRPYDLQTGIILLYPFWTGCLYFIFFNLITLARTLSTILKRTGENGYFCLIPDLRERAIKFSSLSRMVSVGFGVIYNLYYVEMHTIPSLLRVFLIIIITNKWWILSNAFLASPKPILWFLFFITLIDFHILKNPCIPGINSIWSWSRIFLMRC